jgi:hypothetical protein
MSAPAYLKSQFPDLNGSTMLPALETLFRMTYNQSPLLRDQILNEKKVSNGIWQYSSVHDMALFAQIAEGEDYSFTRPRPGSSTTLVPVKFGLGASISDEALADAKYEVAADIIEKMAKSARESQEISFCNLFNNGFSTVTTADGVALFSTTHTLPSGATVANRLSTDADLSWSMVQTMRSEFEKNFRGDSGIYYDIKPKKILVHSDQRFYAEEILGSMLKPDTSDNNKNSLSSEGLQILSSPRLTDLDATFMLADKNDHQLMVIKSSGVETKSKENFENDSVLYKARYREIVGAADYWGVFGTTGAS